MFKLEVLGCRFPAPVKPCFAGTLHVAGLVKWTKSKSSGFYWISRGKHPGIPASQHPSIPFSLPPPRRQAMVNVQGVKDPAGQLVHKLLQGARAVVEPGTGGHDYGSGLSG